MKSMRFPSFSRLFLFCWLMQFESTLNDPNGKAMLYKFIDPALKDDYPIEAVWKVLRRVYWFALILNWLGESYFWISLDLMILWVMLSLQMAQLARRCTQEYPDSRPSMRNAVVQLMTLATMTQEWDDRGNYVD